MVVEDSIQSLLERGVWTTSRAKQSKPPENPAPVRANQSSKLNSHVPRSFDLAPTTKILPPPPTVEDETESLARELDAVTLSGSDEEPKYRGDVEQHPIILPVHEHNPERRFVLLSPESDSDESDDGYEAAKERKPNVYEANTSRKAASLQPNSADDRNQQSKPDLKRQSSRQDLPRLDTDLRPPAETGRHRSRSKSHVTIDQQRPDLSTESSRRDGSQQDEAQPPPVIMHTTKGRDRAYWDLNGGSNGDLRSAPVRSDRRGPLSEDRWPSAHPTRSLGGHARHSSGVEPPRFTRQTSEQGQDHYRDRDRDRDRDRETSGLPGRRRRDSSPPALRRKHSSPPRSGRPSVSPLPTRSSKESLPGRTPSYRRRRRSPTRDEDGYSSDDRKSQHPLRSRRSTVGRDSRPSMLVPEDSRIGNGGGRLSTMGLDAPSSPSRFVQEDQFPNLDPPRSPRSATFPKDPTTRHYDDEVPGSAYGSSLTELSGPVAAGVAGVAGAAAATLPLIVNLANSDTGDRRRPLASPTTSQHGSFLDSPTRPSWQAPPSSATPAEVGFYLDRPIRSYRRYCEDLQRGLVPQLPECRRKFPQAGLTDWLTIARSENFDICPDCYNTVFANSEFKREIVMAPPRSPDRPANCDFGSSIWYRIAFLMTLKYGYPDLRLLRNVAAAAARYSPCAGARNDTRVWYGIVDPHARRTIPTFNVCHCCAREIEGLFPNLAGVFVPLDPSSEPRRSLCSMHYVPGRKRFGEFVDLFETTSDRAISDQSPPNLQWLADKVREKSLDDECMRNFPVIGQSWHVMGDIPHFTVCPECFDAVVWPVIDDGPSPVADSFLRDKQRRQVGACQLYSARMRGVFREACRRNDLGFLEDQLDQRNRALQALSKRHESLVKQDPNDPRTRERLAEIYKEMKQWE